MKNILLLLTLIISSCNYPTTTFWVNNKTDKQVQFNAGAFHLPNHSIMTLPFTTPPNDSVLLRTIELNSSCQRMNVNSIQCLYIGQMNWSLHKSLEGAKMQTQVQYEATKGKGKLLEEEEVPIIFEGKESTAIRTLYKIKVPKIVMGCSNELINYYVSEEIRGRYISCVLSHYSNDSLTENGVPALLAKVMKLKS